ncbi:non-hydrolyzing UDP-N-acetylglucosamine 2-epimerase [Legionella londiniensis]|uniref:UDP-N-acetylglucosamine 2-epimerase n=1 Tax=Legionella londiniensis TaxID=45068 RepID=A0A0W0VN51_9GAMM|nr:UDP-N-acetylglucosamine 2-epimerase (non-hydrolyzing) [Legionella londiniensis]KTD21586.1 UDP-N-acetylglucosamine 2-epimerase [Legionella londiniensis]STX93530.1 UDP-N-acetylglucosamine 2-epimerase [Legionella londiniensis]
MKISTIIGARPQFIKAAAVSRIIAADNDMEEIIIHSGQHYNPNMSSCFFDELNIPEPRYNLKIGSGSHGKQTGEMLIAVENVLQMEKPDLVIVYGDTNTTLAGALSAAKLKIPVFHIEAGLRSHNRSMPEEINRILTDHISSILFTPSESSSNQLLKEGISSDKIFNVGDVMYDAILFYNHFNSNRTTIVNRLNLKPKSYCLATVHRAENTDCQKKLTNIFEALSELSRIMQVILPLHPRTHLALQKTGKLEKYLNNIFITEPVGYLDMLALEMHAKLIITDSGGVQKEAYFNKIPCITIRNESEWIELINSGWNKLCPPDSPFSFLPFIDKEHFFLSENYRPFYGDGNASRKIVEKIKSIFNT